MTHHPQNILLFGATGQIGSHILSALLSARTEFQRIAIFTSLSTATSKAEHLNALKANGVEVIVGDLTAEADVKRAYEGISLPTTYPITISLHTLSLHPDLYFPNAYTHSY
jgi:nucleoside-diphosphate-sugar epimerase